MGLRKFHYIYKQKPRLPDERESVVIGKIALEYRKLRAIQNGGHMDSLYTQNQKMVFKDKKQE